MFGHRVATGPAAPLDVENSLGPGIMGSIGDIAQHGDLGPAIEPADVIGGPVLGHDFSAEHPHRPQPLADRPPNHHLDRRVPGPDPPADPVLALGFDLEMPRPVGQRGLDFFL